MNKENKDQLDYFEIIKYAKNIDSVKAKKKAKLAILSDAATQQVAEGLKGSFAYHEIYLEIYQAPINSFEMEVFDQNSEFYKFAPDMVLIFRTTQFLRQNYYACTNKEDFYQQTYNQTKQIIDHLSQSNILMIHCNYVLPYERPFGSLTLSVPTSLVSTVYKLNYELNQIASKSDHLFICDVSYIASLIGLNNWFDDKLWDYGMTPSSLSAIPYISNNILQLFQANQGKIIKCIILDLDNTLWGGIIGDDGLEGIALGHDNDGEAFSRFQHYLKSLKERGIILCVCSKNNEDVAIKVFKEHQNMVLREEDIAVFIANWNNKADNIKEIQEVLNIGFDSMAFIDDNPFERNLVRELLPEVIVPEMPEDPSEFVRYLSQLNLFEVTNYSAEDSKRVKMYREQAKRKKIEKSYSDISEYLKSLQMKASIARFDRQNLPRIAQLIQRSNQFNLTTIRYTAPECESMMKDTESVIPFYIKLEDKFGDYGLISVIILKLREDDLLIDEWLMSCRVMKRGVEQMAMNYIFEIAQQKGLKKVCGSYIPTAKNSLVKNFYRDFNFKMIQEDEQQTVWERSVDDYQQYSHFINLS